MRGCVLRQDPGRRRQADRIFLRRTYHQDKIFIIGHSFGSVLGLHLIDAFPDYYFAYVGMGQVIDDGKIARHRLPLAGRQAEGGQRRRRPGSAPGRQGLPPGPDRPLTGIFYKGKTMFDVIQGSPYYYEGYLDLFRKSMNFTRDCLTRNFSIKSKNIPRDLVRLKVPVYFFEGRHDRIPACAPELVVEYCRKVRAPRKEIVWFEESAHHRTSTSPKSSRAY